jgi:Mrp family chromosome partitioning ATPase
MRRLDKLYVMTAGGVAPNPVEILSLGKMRELIKYLKTEFDTILLDATPMMPVSDARVLVGLSDGVIMVARRGKTSCSSIQRAFKVLDLKKLMGVVFNDVKPMLFHTHYDSSFYKYGQQRLYPGATKRIKNRTKTYLEE